MCYCALETITSGGQYDKILYIKLRTNHYLKGRFQSMWLVAKKEARETNKTITDANCFIQEFKDI